MPARLFTLDCGRLLRVHQQTFLRILPERLLPRVKQTSESSEIRNTDFCKRPLAALSLATTKTCTRRLLAGLTKGCDFLGYQISPGNVVPFDHNVRRYRANVARLYEQGAPRRRIEQYRHRWMGWALGRLGDCVSPSFIKQYGYSGGEPVQILGSGTVNSST